MKILYIHSAETDHEFYNDYMNDLLLHGLREIYGNDVIDYPGCWYLYNDEINKREFEEKRFWGKGFTIKNILKNFSSIDREDIKQKIKNKYFDLVIYGSIRRSDLFFDDVVKYNNKFIFIDGEDDNHIDTKYSNQGLYFKRELLSEDHRVKPISFAIPKSKILKEIDYHPKNILAPLIPGRLNTYIYDNEKSYYEMYKKSIFALTYKKAGWDCLRHYEILMNGCIPLFLDLENCPKNIITTLPKGKLINILNEFNNIFSFYNPFKIFKKKHLTFQRILKILKFNFKSGNLENFIEKNESVFELKKDLLNFTKKNLTTESLAKYTLDCFKEQ